MVNCVHCDDKTAAQCTRIRVLKRVTNSAKQHELRPFKGELGRYLRVLAHILVRVSVYILGKVLATISSGRERRAVPKQSWESLFLERFLEG